MRIFFSTVVSVLWLCVNMVYAGSPEAKSLSSWGTPIPAAQLEAQRGGTDLGPQLIINNRNDLKAKLYDNVAVDNVTGNNSINGNAFADAGGVVTVFQNSGNNVIMQSGTVLNLTLK
jgi:hypothetical protein